jgi:iron complex transport system ATP-binding protein
MKTHNNILFTKNLEIGYPEKGRKKNVLQNHLNLNLKAGELACLLGPNGCGKSMLIRTLSGFHKAMAGEIMIFNRRLSEMSPAEISRIISVALTEPTDVSNMSVFEVVGFGRSPYTGFLGKLGKHDFEIIQKSLENAGISHLHGRQFNQLSDGEKQKVMIAKSLAQETSVMFLDEPTAFLDFPSKIEILQLLRQTAWEHQKAILLTTHDVNLALKFADKIWLMGVGVPVITGVPEDLILNNEFGKYFDNEKTRFDVTSGSFTIEAKETGKVIVEGAGLKYEWLLKALLRKGFRVLSSENSFSEAPFITVKPENENVFELKVAGTVYEFNAVGEMLEKLKDFSEI